MIFLRSLVLSLVAISPGKAAAAVPVPMPATEALQHLTENYTLPLAEGNFDPANLLLRRDYGR